MASFQQIKDDVGVAPQCVLALGDCSFNGIAALLCKLQSKLEKMKRQHDHTEVLGLWKFVVELFDEGGKPTARSMAPKLLPALFSAIRTIDFSCSVAREACRWGWARILI